MPDDLRKVSKDNWRFRRRVVFVSLFWIAFMVTYIVFRGTDSSLYRDTAVALLGAFVAIIGSYVFGAVWDDNSKRREYRPGRMMPPPPDDDMRGGP